MADYERINDLLLQYEELREQGHEIPPEELCRSCPELLPEFEKELQAQQRIDAFLNLDHSGDSAVIDEHLPIIDGYEILAELGRGGMGVVYKARQLSLDRPVALKVILVGPHSSTRQVERFRAEARTIASLHHANIVQVYDVGEQNGQPYFTMELVEGSSLTKQITGPANSPADAARLVHTLAQAMAAAHRRDIIHRNLKPANVLIDADSTPKIADFGLAKQLQASDRQTQTGQIVGTPCYMAPELADGQGKAAGPTTDVYGLGTILYQLLTGRPPFQSESSLDLLEQIRSHEPASPRRLNSAVPRDLETICLKCLQKQPRKRYPTSQDLAADLSRFLSGMPIQARPVSFPERTFKWARRHPTPAAVAIVSLLAFVLILWQWLRAESALQEARQQTRAEAEARMLAELNEQKFYFGQVSLARREWNAGNLNQALRYLDECPAKLRGWEWHYVNHLCRPETLSLTGHAKGLTEIAYSPDGQYLASASRDGTVKIWNAKSGQLTRTFEKHEDVVFAVAWSPDGTMIASAGKDKTVRLWKAKTGQTVRIFRKHSGPVRCLAFSPDGTKIASAGGDKTILVWNAATGEVSLSLIGHQKAVLTVAFSPDGKQLASGGLDETLKGWKLTDGKMLYDMPEHYDSIAHVAYSPDGRYLATADYNHSIFIWGASAGVFLRKLHGHTGWVNSVAFNSDCTKLATAGDDGFVKLWSVKDWRPAFSYLGGAGFSSVAFSPDGKFLSAGSDDKLVRVWDIRRSVNPSTFGEHNDFVQHVNFSSDGQSIVSCSNDSMVKVWDFPSRGVMNSIETPSAPVHCVAITADGKQLVTAEESPALNVWDAKSGRLLRKLVGHADHAYSVCFHPDGKRCLSASADKTVRLWATATGQELRCYRGHSGRVNAVCYSPNAIQFAAGSDDHTARIWNSKTGQCLHVLKHNKPVRSVAYSSDGTLVASGDVSGTVKIWNAKTGKLFQSFNGHTGTVRSLAFHPGGQYLATGSQDTTIKLWNLPLRREALVLRGHDNDVTCVAFSPDGWSLVSASDDRTIKLWNATQK